MIRQQEIRFSVPDNIPMDEIIASIQQKHNLLEESARTVTRTFLDSFDWRLATRGITIWSEQIDENTIMYACAPAVDNTMTDYLAL